jgi:dihydroorotate dehydrogenase (NAD+) catalytic subunit
VEARGNVFAHSEDATRTAMRAVVESVGDAVPTFAKLSPNVTDIVPIAAAALDAGATGLTLVNSVMGLLIDARARTPRLGAGGGGLTGAPIKPVALRAVWDVSRAFPRVPIIGTGGVTTGTDAIEMMLAGATAVGVGTATFADPRAPLRIVREIEAWCAQQRVEYVRELIGGLR